jgi:uncharacterized damage-inducible protein DinB
MSNILFGKEYLVELESEAAATRKCLERVTENLFSWKPHERSMNMGYLTLLVAEIPKWIWFMVEKPDIDLATFTHVQPTTNAELVKHFDENMKMAKEALAKISNEEILKPFYLKANGQTIHTTTKKESISSTINHWVHHRGQLTVYMRLNDLPVPSIYGPSADERL